MLQNFLHICRNVVKRADTMRISRVHVLIQVAKNTLDKVDSGHEGVGDSAPMVVAKLSKVRLQRVEKIVHTFFLWFSGTKSG